ncbi:hypothetical protein Vretifemale_575 [Volvox reticuliferus]|uniref:Uncharacterized protein n=1 Tax=Volvox reticuliferus TaxID=1737510 RepID=A0A8J4BVY6_9CHLO|nr:hypothetical protein Vretifemale_575 [Volvox reticuliferus]
MDRSPLAPRVAAHHRLPLELLVPLPPPAAAALGTPPPCAAELPPCQPSSAADKQAQGGHQYSIPEGLPWPGGCSAPRKAPTRHTEDKERTDTQAAAVGNAPGV